MKNTLLYTIALFTALQLLSSCEKQENKLEGLVLFNSFEEGNGIELMKIDSFREWHGPNPLPNIKGYFHINYELFDDTSKINRVVVHRNGYVYGVYFFVAPGNQLYFVDVFASPGAHYDYQLSLVMDDSSETKKTITYPIDF